MKVGGSVSAVAGLVGFVGSGAIAGASFLYSHVPSGLRITVRPSGPRTSTGAVGRCAIAGAASRVRVRSINNRVMANRPYCAPNLLRLTPQVWAPSREVKKDLAPCSISVLQKV